MAMFELYYFLDLYHEVQGLVNDGRGASVSNGQTYMEVLCMYLIYFNTLSPGCESMFN